MKMIFVSFSILILFLAGAIAEGFHVYIIIHQWPTMLMIYGPLVAYVLSVQGFRGSVSLFGRLSSQKLNESDLNFLRQLVTLSLFLGSLGTMIGIMITMAYLTAGTEKIGELIAASLVSTILGVVPCILLLPVMRPSSQSKYMLQVAIVFAGFAIFSGLGISSLTIWAIR